MSTISPSPKNFFKDIKGNLTKVTWHHAVNNKTALSNAMSSDVMMLEADVILGTLKGSSPSEKIPVMGHPPNTESDLSLSDFIDTVLKSGTKGMKLDFKSIEAFSKSSEILENNKTKMTVPLWINADILLGPVNATNNQATPVDPKQFLAIVTKKLSESTLSVGWVTKYGINYKIENGSYTIDQIKEMLKTLKDNDVTQNVTYPVRAGLAANDIEVIKNLVKDNPLATLSIWSSESDHVDGKKLSNLIKEIGFDKVYVDVPKNVWDTLDLNPSTKGGASYFTSSIVLTFVASIYAASFFTQML